jgi:hypothetical protein
MLEMQGKSLYDKIGRHDVYYLLGGAGIALSIKCNNMSTAPVTRLAPDLFSQQLVPDTESFHNTIALEGVELEKAEKGCNHQEERILRIFATHGGQMTPFDVCNVFNKMYQPIPITSVRRAITNLTKRGKLHKCDRMKKEIYGKPNYYWKLA